jgi:phosphocarrier protein
MMQREFMIINAIGLHARPAAKFVQHCKKMGGKITVAKGDKVVDATSITSVMMLGVHAQDKILVQVDCETEEQEHNALDTLGEQIENRFGEQE